MIRICRHDTVNVGLTVPAIFFEQASGFGSILSHALSELVAIANTKVCFNLRNFHQCPGRTENRWVVMYRSIIVNFAVRAATPTTMCRTRATNCIHCLDP